MHSILVRNFYVKDLRANSARVERNIHYTAPRDLVGEERVSIYVRRIAVIASKV
jgi:hypothetical protein